jgi:hypothetical protein
VMAHKANAAGNAMRCTGMIVTRGTRALFRVKLPRPDDPR